MLAEEIKKRRLDLGLTQERLATLSGCRRLTIVKLEKENAKGSDLVLHSIDKALTKLEDARNV